MKFTIKTSLCLLLGLQVGCQTAKNLPENHILLDYAMLREWSDTCSIQGTAGFKHRHEGRDWEDTYLIYNADCFSFVPIVHIQGTEPYRQDAYYLKRDLEIPPRDRTSYNEWLKEKKQRESGL